MSAKDFELAGRADDVANALAGKLPQTMGALLYARETVLRHRDQTYAVMPFTLEYREGMPEADLRRWAAGLAKALTDG